MKAGNFQKYLSQPYPYYYNQSGLHKTALGILLLCFSFLYFFEPFGVYHPEHKMSFVWICLAHSVIPAFIGYTYFTGINFFLRKEEEWNTGKEILNLSLVLLLIGTASFFIRDLIYDNPDNRTFRYFWEEIRNTFLAGILFTAILVPLNFNRLFRKHQLLAFKIDASDKRETAAEELQKEVHIRTQLKGDDFALGLSKFLFAKAAGNYVEIFFTNEKAVTKLLKRITIKELEKQLSPFSYITRTHRAYLVNTRRITNINGNAQGYLLSFEDFPEKVPVSRGMIAEFNRLVKKKA